MAKKKSVMGGGKTNRSARSNYGRVKGLVGRQGPTKPKKAPKGDKISTKGGFDFGGKTPSGDSGDW